MCALSKTARVRTFIGLGTNVGDREKHLKRTIQFLREMQGFRLKRISRFYETEPVGVRDQRPFLNGVVEGESSLTPEALLTALKTIEHEVGRTPRERWGPREIDLDLLFYGDLVVEEPSLILPHPRLHERIFVLLPLSELCETLFHPKLKKSIKELLAECVSTDARPPRPYPLEVTVEKV